MKSKAANRVTILLADDMAGQRAPFGRILGHAKESMLRRHSIFLRDTWSTL